MRNGLYVCMVWYAMWIDREEEEEGGGFCCTIITSSLGNGCFVVFWEFGCCVGSKVMC